MLNFNLRRVRPIYIVIYITGLETYYDDNQWKIAKQNYIRVCSCSQMELKILLSAKLKIQFLIRVIITIFHSLSIEKRTLHFYSRSFLDY